MERRWTAIVACLWIVAASGVSSDRGKRAELAVPLICCQPAEQPPKIDGKLDDPGWRSAQRVLDFHDCEKETLPEARTEVLLSHDDEYLYLAYKRGTPRAGEGEPRSRCDSATALSLAHPGPRSLGTFARTTRACSTPERPSKTIPQARYAWSSSAMASRTMSTLPC